MYGEYYFCKGFNEAWEKIKTAGGNKLGRPLDCTFHDLKAKDISDYKGSGKEKSYSVNTKLNNKLLFMIGKYTLRQH